MGKPDNIPLPGDESMAVVYEDRAILIVDKPPGWTLGPTGSAGPGRNLQAALETSLRAGEPWAKSRDLKFLRYVHRLDAESSGLLVLAKSPETVAAYGRIFEQRTVRKWFWAVVHGVPKEDAWVCNLALASPNDRGIAKVDTRRGHPAETRFRVLERLVDVALVEAQPLTGRTHQVRLHLRAAGYPVLGDPLYAKGEPRTDGMALRAVQLEFPDPATGRKVRITAPSEVFLTHYQFHLLGKGLQAAPETRPSSHE